MPETSTTFREQMRNRSSRPVVLVAIADASARQMATELLDGLNWTVVSTASGSEALAQLDRTDCQALLLDSWLPDLHLSEFIDECRKRHPAIDLIQLDEVITGTQAHRHPRRQELLFVLRQALQHQPAATGRAITEDDSTWSHAILREEDLVAVPSGAPSVAIVESPRAMVDAERDVTHLPEFVGGSPVMREFTRMIRLVAPRRTPVLIEGPTGTGKELTAQAIHRLSPRGKRPMVVLNCAAIPEALLEAEVFGHTRGAFTGAVSSRVGRVEAANGGTLFLDEIGEMPLQLQSKLLRFLECGELQRVGENESIQVDVRVIAATNQPLVKRVAEGAFRADLYYRLSVFPIATPALMQHPEDIPQLAQHFLKRHAQTGPAKEFSTEAAQKLQAHTWPGNVRELEHCIERAYILADDARLIAAQHIQFGNF